MHSVTFVLLRLPVDDVAGAVQTLLAPHRHIDEGPYDRTKRFDYWTVGDEDIADFETAAALGVAEDEDFRSNVCFVSRLNGRKIPAALITSDGVWYDLFDFGWRFSPEETPANRDAWERWSARVNELLAQHADCVAVQIDTHS